MMIALSSIQVAAIQLAVQLHPLREPFWSGHNRFLVVGLVTAMALASLTVGVLSLVSRDRARKGSTMRRLCRALALDAPQRRLLQNIASRTGVQCPATLLISSGCFDTARRRYNPQPAAAQQLRSVRKRIFDR